MSSSSDSDSDLFWEMTKKVQQKERMSDFREQLARHIEEMAGVLDDGDGYIRTPNIYDDADLIAEHVMQFLNNNSDVS